MPEYPLSTIAELIKLTPQRVRQLVKEGIIPDSSKGQYDLVKTVQAYIDYLRGLCQGKDTTKIAEEKKLIEERRQFISQRRRKAAGELLEKHEVEQISYAAGQMMSEGLLSLDSRICDLVTAESDYHKNSKTINREVRAIMENVQQCLSQLQEKS